MIEQSLIAWMTSGGERFESRDDRRMREHRLALREASELASARGPLGGLLARWTARPESRPELSLATDCCPA